MSKFAVKRRKPHSKYQNQCQLRVKVLDQQIKFRAILKMSKVLPFIEGEALFRLLEISFFQF